MLGVRQLRSAGQRLNEQSIYSGWSIGVLIRSVRRNNGSNNTKAFWPHRLDGDAGALRGDGESLGSTHHT